MGVTSFILGILCFFATFLLIDSSLKILLILLLLISFIFGLISTCTGKARGLGITGLVLSTISIIIIFGSMGTKNNKSTNNINSVGSEVVENGERAKSNNNIELNQTVTTKDWEFSISNVYFGQKINPPATNYGYHNYYKVDNTDDTYLCVILDAKNLSNIALSAESVATVRVKYKDYYEYSSFSVSPDSTLGFTYSSITSIKPLTSDKVYYLAKMPNSISAETDTSLQIEITVNGTTYSYNYR